MSSVMNRKPLLRLVSQSRALSSPAIIAPSASSVQIKSSTLSNGMLIVAGECPSKIAKLAVTIKAGSRYESAGNCGVSHILRSSCGLTTKSASQFLLTKKLQSMGSSLSAVGERETITYVLESLQENLDESLKILKAVVAEQVFKPWELSDNVARVKYELSAVPPQAIAFDLAYQAAYRRGLGNSLFVREFNIKKIGSETLQHFVASQFTASKTSVVGLGVRMEDVIDFAEKLNFSLGDGRSVSNPSAFRGGDLREEKGSSNVDIVIAGEASGLNKKDVFAWAVLRQALGSGSSIKWGAGVDPISKVANNHPGAAVRAFSSAHSDSGLFGISISCKAIDARDIIASTLKIAAQELSPGDIKRAKAQLVHQILGGDSDGFLYDLAGQASLLGAVTSPSSVACEIDAVSPDAVQRAQSAFAKGPKALGAVGNVNRVPYLDEL